MKLFNNSIKLYQIYVKIITVKLLLLNALLPICPLTFITKALCLVRSRYYLMQGVFSPEKNFQVHQTWVQSCPINFPARFYWYGSKRANPGCPPKWVDRLMATDGCLFGSKHCITLVFLAGVHNVLC